MNSKKILSLATSILLSVSPVLTVIACNKPKERIEAKLIGDLEQVAYAIFSDGLNNKSNITAKTIFEKYKSQITDYTINIIKEVMIRHEFAKVENRLQNKSDTFTTEEYNSSQQAFDALWNQLAGEVLYEQYLKARISGQIFEIGIIKQGFIVTQDETWHIKGTVKNDFNDKWSDTKEKTVVELMKLDTKSLVSFKKALQERFKEYYTTNIKPNLLDSLMKITWLKERIFRKEPDASYSINPNWEFPRAIQTWDTDSVWKSKVKMVWEMKVLSNDDAKLTKLPQVGNYETPNAALKEKFNSEDNLTKTKLDPIFNMAGFRGFAAYANADSNATYGDQETMESGYKQAVFNQHIAGITRTKLSTSTEDISDFYSGNNNKYVSRVYTLPIYLIDILKTYKVNNKSIDLTKDNLESHWTSNKKGSDTNIARNNKALQGLSNLQKTAILNQLLNVVSKNDATVSLPQISKDLYLTYVQNKDNVLDKNIWSKIESHFKE